MQIPPEIVAFHDEGTETSGLSRGRHGPLHHLTEREDRLLARRP